MLITLNGSGVDREFGEAFLDFRLKDNSLEVNHVSRPENQFVSPISGVSTGFFESRALPY
jgi:hypothetical protein